MRRRSRPEARWLASARWRRLRLEVARRAGWCCQQTGVALTTGRSEPNALVVDHIVPHRGDPALFWDERNLQAVAKAWHDSVKQQRERAGGGGGGVIAGAAAAANPRPQTAGFFSGGAVSREV